MVKQKCISCIHGGGVFTHLSTYSKKVPVCMYFVIFLYARYFHHALLPLATTLIAIYRAFAKIIFLSIKCFTTPFSMELLIGYLELSPLEMRGQMGRYICNGGHSKCTCI